MSEILAIGLILFFGYFVGRLISRLKMPTVTGYILLGLAFGVSLLKIIPKDLNLKLTWLIEFALLLVAFNVGMELRIDTFRRLGRSLILIIVLETVGAFLFLFMGMMLMRQGVTLSLLIAAIGCATAPAVTVLVLNEYRAAGPLTQVLLACVGMDDAIGLTFYSVCASIAHGMFDKTQISVAILIGKIVLGVSISIMIGVAFGILLDLITRKVTFPLDILVIAVGTIMLAGGLLQLRPHGVRFSPLIASMAIGFYIANFAPRHRAIRGALEHFSMPFYVVYFVLAGARLDFKLLMALGWVAAVYLICRFSGKLFGAWLGGTISRAPRAIRRYTGFGLFSQAGIAIGLCLYAAKEFPQVGDVIVAIALGTTVVTELIGPLMTKFAILRAGEAYRR